MVPKVDTFAKDISEEIKHKEASLADIATASNDIGNSKEEASPLENRSSKIFLVAIGFLVMGICALIAFVYYYFSALSIPEQPIQLAETATSTKASSLSTLSVTLNDNIGRHVSRVEKRERGYVLTLSSYAPVFAYITRKESDYVIQLIDVVSPEKPGAQNSTPKIPASPSTTATGTTPSTTTSSSTSTSSPSTTGAQASSSGAVITDDEPTWSNVTLSNVNIRIFTEGERSIAYSFVSTEKLIIAATAEDILATKNAILR